MIQLQTRIISVGHHSSAGSNWKTENDPDVVDMNPWGELDPDGDRYAVDPIPEESTLP